MNTWRRGLTLISALLGLLFGPAHPYTPIGAPNVCAGGSCCPERASLCCYNDECYTDLYFVPEGQNCPPVE